MEHKGTVTLTTDRLILRRYRIEDADTAYRNWLSSETVTRFLTWTPHRSVAESQEYIQSVIDRYGDTEYTWVIEEKDSGEVVGAIGVNSFSEDTAACEIGYCLSDSRWGRGYMTEAFTRVIGYLFDEVGFNRVFSTHDVNNPASGRVMEKCGLRYEGTMRQAARNNQGICDQVIRAKLKDDK